MLLPESLENDIKEKRSAKLIQVCPEQVEKIRDIFLLIIHVDPIEGQQAYEYLFPDLLICLFTSETKC